jgi:hypothetical protein
MNARFWPTFAFRACPGGQVLPSDPVARRAFGDVVTDGGILASDSANGQRDASLPA